MSAEPPVAPAPDAPASGASRRFSADHAMASIWLVFLLIPITLAWSFDRAGLAWQIVATMAIIGFGSTYAFFVLRQVRRSPVGGLPLWRVAVGALMLLPFVLASLPALGGGVTSFAPYVAAMGAFSLPLRWLFAWSGGTLAATVAVTLALERADWLSFALGPAIGITFVAIIRLLEDLGDAERRSREERAWVHEREAISRDIHDLLGHSLTVVSLKTQLARRTLHTDPARAEAELDEVLALTQRALDEVRSTVGRLRTPDLAAQYETATTALADAGIQVDRHGDWQGWDPERRALAAWALREATTNILRHAQASTCRIDFQPDALVIADDGIGLHGAQEGHGLTGLRRRVADGGGELRISDRENGAELRVEFA